MIGKMTMARMPMFHCVAVYRKYVAYMPSIRNSPCAILTTLITPKIRFRPTLMRA